MALEPRGTYYPGCTVVGLHRVHRLFDRAKMNCNLVILVCLFSVSRLYQAEGYIVDAINGNDNNNGETINSPFKTIAKCLDALANPGDECLIRAGNYHEMVNISGLQGELTFFICTRLNSQLTVFNGYS